VGYLALRTLPKPWNAIVLIAFAILAEWMMLSLVETYPFTR
jgi:hypothetical protein